MDKSLNSLDVLRKQIKRAEAQLIQSRTQANTGESDDEVGVLFAGNWHDSIPRRLIVDEELAPVEKTTWMVIRSTINSPQQPGSTPKRADLARSINCSPPTVSTSQAMLRIMRWMCQCKPVRHQGRFVGNILLMSDEPLSLATVLELDDSYIEFLEATARNGNRNSRMRKAAAEKLKEVDASRVDLRQPTQMELMAERTARGFGGFKGATINMPNEADVGESAAETSSSDSESAHLSFSNAVPVPQSIANDLKSRHQSKNFAPVTNAVSSVQSVKNQPGVQSDPQDTRGGEHQSKILSPVENDQSKFFAPVETHQSKILSPVGGMDNTRENLPRIGGNSTETHQSKFFAPADKGGLGGGFVCSSSSLENNNNSYLSNNLKTTTTTINPVSTYPRARGRRHSGSEAHALETFDLGHAESFEAERERLIDELIEENPLQADYEDLNRLVARHLPELAHPRLEKFVQYLLGPRKPNIPQIARLLKPLNKQTRSRVLFQLMGKTASDWGGWSKEPLSNAVGYLRSLINAEQQGNLKLDDFAIRLMRAVETDTEPYIPPTIDREQELRAHDPRQKDFFGQKLSGEF